MKTTLLTAAATIALLAGGSAIAQTTAAPAAPKPTEQPAAPATAQPAPAAATPAPATTATPAAAGALVAQGDIIDTLKASGKFTILIRTLDETNLTSLIKTNKNLTLFAPTDAAFAALPAGELKRLEENPQELQKLLTYHLINAPIDSTKVKERAGNVATVAGPQITLDNSGAAFTAGPATVTQADVKATNGFIHVVDKVLMPGGTPVAANMTTDMPPSKVNGGRIIRASYQPVPSDPPADAGMAPATAPPADPADPNATDPATGAPADPAAMAEPAAPAPVMTPTQPAAPAASVAAATAEPAQVTNGPVMDTAENRAKYPPQSRAGKRTAAKGN